METAAIPAPLHNSPLQTQPIPVTPPAVISWHSSTSPTSPHVLTTTTTVCHLYSIFYLHSPFLILKSVFLWWVLDPPMTSGVFSFNFNKVSPLNNQTPTLRYVTRAQLSSPRLSGVACKIPNQSKKKRHTNIAYCSLCALSIWSRTFLFTRRSITVDTNITSDSLRTSNNHYKVSKWLKRKYYLFVYSNFNKSRYIYLEKNNFKRCMHWLILYFWLAKWCLY